jgi:hypothetical protein
VHALTPSNDGRFVAAGGNGTLLIVDAVSSEAVYRLRANGWVMGLQWSEDDRLLAVGGHDKGVRVYDVSSGIKLLEVGRARGAWPLHLAFSPLGRALADGNREVCVHSCDGSRLPIRKHVDATALLRFPAPEWDTRLDEAAAGIDLSAGLRNAAPGGAEEVTASRRKFVALLVKLVKRNPILAFNPLPTEDEIGASKVRWLPCV